MIALTPAFVLASLAVTALAGRDGANRARHARAARILQSRDAIYTLSHNYTATDFLDESKWSYFTGADPTNGKVDYLGLSDAKNAGLVKAKGNQFTLSAQSGSLPSGTDRKSVRISSVDSWGKGVLIADFEKMPYGCGVWPAFWTVGPNWPEGGEIDIIEGVNMQGTNQLTLHSGTTGTSCTTDPNPGLFNGVTPFLANLGNKNCASSNNNNAGCTFFDTDPNSFGAGFNSVGGRVMAVLRDEVGIAMWSWTHSDVPADILAGKPNPDLWSSPKAFWSSSSCNFDEHFSDQTITLNVDVGGGWVESDLASSSCGTDIASIVANGDNFNNAAWTVNYISVYSA